MGFNCTIAAPSEEDLTASDSRILSPHYGFRPASAAEDASLPHKCWSRADNKEQHICWIDGSLHKLSEVPGVSSGEDMNRIGDGKEEEEELHDQISDSSDTTPVTNVCSSVMAGVGDDTNATMHRTNVRSSNVTRVRVEKRRIIRGTKTRTRAVARRRVSNGGTAQSTTIGTPAVANTGIDNSSTTPDIDIHSSTVASSIGVNNIGAAPGTNVHLPAMTGIAANNYATTQGTNIHNPAIATVRVNNKDLKIMTLFQKNVLRVGDQWKFSFVFQTASGEVLVEKVGTVTGLSRPGGRSRSSVRPWFPDLCFPPAQYVFSDPARQNLTIQACTGPDGFCKAVLQAYGPIQSDTNVRNKSWRSIHVLRNGQDLGTLADIRENFEPDRDYP